MRATSAKLDDLLTTFEERHMSIFRSTVLTKSCLFALVIAAFMTQAPHCAAAPLPGGTGDGNVTPFTCGSGVISQFIDAGVSEQQFAFDGTGKVVQSSTSAGSGGNAAGCSLTNLRPGFNGFSRIELLLNDPNPNPGLFVTLKFCFRAPVTGEQFTDHVSLDGFSVTPLGNNWFRFGADAANHNIFNFKAFNSAPLKVTMQLNSTADARSIKFGGVKIFYANQQINNPIQPSTLVFANLGCSGPNDCPFSGADQIRDRVRSRIERVRERIRNNR